DRDSPGTEKALHIDDVADAGRLRGSRQTVYLLRNAVDFAAWYDSQPAPEASSLRHTTLCRHAQPPPCKMPWMRRGRRARRPCPTARRHPFHDIEIRQTKASVLPAQAWEKGARKKEKRCPPPTIGSKKHPAAEPRPCPRTKARRPPRRGLAMEKVILCESVDATLSAATAGRPLPGDGYSLGSSPSSDGPQR